MARLLRMPEVSADALEAVLSEWQVPENTPFTAGDSIATIETEKAVVDVPADSDGVILKTLVPAGAMVTVGAPIALLGDPGEVVDDLSALLADLGVAPDPAPATTPRSVFEQVAAVAAAAEGRGVRIFSSPLARRLAKEAELPMSVLRGTGPGGRIVRRDVQEAINTRHAPLIEPATSLQPTEEAVAARLVADGYLDIPHSRIRRAIAARLTDSTHDVPHFFLRGTARVDKLLRLRVRLNESGLVKISVNALVVMAAARAHVLVPAMNVIWRPDAVRSFSGVDISVAVATKQGLVAPVLRGVDKMTLSAVATASNELVGRARSGQLMQSELEGGTLTVTNLGMFGTAEFAAIINPPQSAILAIGAAQEKPVVTKGKLRVGMVMNVTLSVDHRPIDGATAAHWMAAFVSLLEEPVRILV